MGDPKDNKLDNKAIYMMYGLVIAAWLSMIVLHGVWKVLLLAGAAVFTFILFGASYLESRFSIGMEMRGK